MYRITNFILPKKKEEHFIIVNYYIFNEKEICQNVLNNILEIIKISDKKNLNHGLRFIFIKIQYLKTQYSRLS